MGRPTLAYLRACLSYDPTTGVLTWLERPLRHFVDAHAQAAWNGRYAGKVAGSLSKNDGSIYIGIRDHPYLAHRVIFVLQKGRWPKQIDHKNRDPADNRWCNLREATTQQNLWNCVKSKGSDLPRGVYRNGLRFMALAQMRLGRIYLGTYDDPMQAHEAWCAAVRNERKEFFRAK